MNTEAAAPSLPLCRVSTRLAPTLRSPRLPTSPSDPRRAPPDFVPPADRAPREVRRTFITSRAGYDHSWIGALAIGLGLLAFGPAMRAAERIDLPPPLVALPAPGMMAGAGA